MNSIPLSVIRELVDSSSPQLRRRFKVATGLSPTDAGARYMSRGRLIVKILEHEFHAIELMVTSPDEHEDRDG